MGSFLEDLKQDVQCYLCSDTLTEPKLLSCFHTFCKPCIRRHTELIEEVNVFKCPKCKSETPLPDLDSVEDLKPSPLHSRMLKVLQFVESEKVCSVSGSHPPASWHCFDCDRSLCDECEKYHSVFTKDHKVVSLVEIKEEDIKLMLSRETNCVKHANKAVEFFCKDCQQNTCIECLKNRHDEHSTVTLGKYTTKNKAHLSEQIEEFKKIEQEMKKQVEIVEEDTSETKANCENAKLLVKERLQEMLDMLQKNAEELLKRIDEHIDKAERRKVKGQSVLDQTHGAIEYMNKLVEKGVASEIIEYKDMKKTCHTSVDQVVGEQLDVLFLSNEDLRKQVNSGLGVIRIVEKTDPSMSSVEIRSNLEVGKKGVLVLIKKTKTGKLKNSLNDVVDVQIHPSKNVEKLKKRITRGKLEVEFMAKVAGYLTAEVQVNGIHVSNSPLVMNIRPPILQQNSAMLSCISNTRESSSSDFQTPKSELKKRGTADFF